MSKRQAYIIKTVATALLVVMIYSTVTFWIRTSFRVSVSANVFGPVARAMPSGFFDAIDKDPNTITHTSIAAYLGFDVLAEASVDQPGNLASAVRNSAVFAFFPIDPNHPEAVQRRPADGIWNVVSFDRDLGLFVFTEARPAKPHQWVTRITHYAGPNAVGVKADSSLGRFASQPEVYCARPEYNRCRNLFFYDSSSTRFFHLDFDKMQISSGPKQPAGLRPSQIGTAGKGPLHIEWGRAFRKPTAAELARIEEHEKNPAAMDDSGRPIQRSPYQANQVVPGKGTLPELAYFKYSEGKYSIPLLEDVKPFDSGPYLLVTDDDGSIKLLEKGSLDIAGQAGRLPVLPDGASNAGPADLLCYATMPLSRKGEYLGMACAAASREGLQVRLNVFGPNGKLISSSGGHYDPEQEPVLRLTRAVNLLTDTLSPLAMTYASMATASTFDASSGYKGLFFMPNCSVASAVRNNANDPATRSIAIVLMPLPALLLSLFLASRIVADAERRGLSRRARAVWLTTGIVLGLPAYITWRLTRPDAVLVTCQNCGKGRRPDFERCHCCNAAWVVPELIAPTWRVTESPEDSGAEADETVAGQ